MTDFSDCKDEQQFKMKYIREVLKPQFDYVFCIETEETVKGFPDVMCLSYKQKGSAYFCNFFEFKFSDKQGKIKFQPTQPAFYKKYERMDIWIVAYNQKTGKVEEFPVWDMSTKKGERRFYMNEKAEVQL